MKKLLFLLLIVSACSSDKEDGDPKPVQHFAGAYAFDTPTEHVEFILTESETSVHIYNGFVNYNVPANTDIVSGGKAVQSIKVYENKTYGFTIIFTGVTLGGGKKLIASHVERKRTGFADYSADNVVITKID